MHTVPGRYWGVWFFATCSVVRADTKQPLDEFSMVQLQGHSIPHTTAGSLINDLEVHVPPDKNFAEIRFSAEGHNHTYKLEPFDVYAPNSMAKAMRTTGTGVMPVSGDSPLHFRSLEKDRWATLTLRNSGHIRGVFVFSTVLYQVEPQSMAEAESSRVWAGNSGEVWDFKTHRLRTLDRSQMSQPMSVNLGRNGSSVMGLKMVKNRKERPKMRKVTKALNVTVISGHHPTDLTQPLGMYFAFDQAAWTTMVNTSDWDDQIYAVTQIRGGTTIWSGEVKVWHGTQGSYGQRHPSALAAGWDWKEGDVVILSAPTPSPAPTPVQFFGDQWYPGCYKDDDYAHFLEIGVIGDVEAHQEYGSALQGMMEEAVVTASLVFMGQMHIDLRIGYSMIFENESTAPSYANGCASGELSDDEMTAKMTSMDNVTAPYQAVFQLFTGCAGADRDLFAVSKWGTVSSNKDGCNAAVLRTKGTEWGDGWPIWLMFSYCLGLQMHASQTFIGGTPGTKGGIMDWGTGQVNGIYQFNTQYNKDEMCSRLDERVGNCQDKFNVEGYTPPTPAPTLTCVDDPPDWKDTGNNGCEIYSYWMDFCTSSGGEGAGWYTTTFSGFGPPKTLADMKSWPDGISVLEACCRCGGGSTKIGYYDRPTPEPTAGPTLEPPTLAPTRAPTPAGWICVDEPEGWADTWSPWVTCEYMEEKSYCTPSGGTGSAYPFSFPLTDFTGSGVTVLEACCACGGGRREAPPPSVTPTSSPTASPTTASPSESPTESPTRTPSAAPTVEPTLAPTAPPTASPTPAPTTPSPTLSGTTCVNDPEDWYWKVYGTWLDCDYVVRQNWCTSSGGAGSGFPWSGEPDWLKNPDGVTVVQACCGCGGGLLAAPPTASPGPETPNPTAVPSAGPTVQPTSSPTYPPTANPTLSSTPTSTPSAAPTVATVMEVHGSMTLVNVAYAVISSNSTLKARLKLAIKIGILAALADQIAGTNISDDDITVSFYATARLTGNSSTAGLLATDSSTSVSYTIEVPPDEEAATVAASVGNSSTVEAETVAALSTIPALGENVTVVSGSASAVPKVLTAPVTAFGDPHLKTIKGEKFDLEQPGNHTFFVIPRGDTDAANAKLHVSAHVERRRGQRCGALYITGVVIRGKTLGSLRRLEFFTGSEELNSPSVHGLKVGDGPSVSTAAFQELVPKGILVNVSRHTPAAPTAVNHHVNTLTIKLRLGPGYIKVGWDHQKEKHGYSNWLWMDVQGYEVMANQIGGILGLDDHSWEQTAPKECAGTEERSRRMMGSGTVIASATLSDVRAE